MPDWLPFPFPPFIPSRPGNEGPRYPGIGPLIEQLLEERRKREEADREPGPGLEPLEPPFDPTEEPPDDGVPRALPGDEYLPPGETNREPQPIDPRIFGPIRDRARQGSRQAATPLPRALRPGQLSLADRSPPRREARARPRASPSLPGLLAAFATKGFGLTLPRPRSGSTLRSASLAFRSRGPGTRPLETETTPGGFEIPYPYPQKIGKPRDRDEAARARVLLDKIHRGESIFPLPDVNPNVPPYRPPRTLPPATTPQEVPLPSPELSPLPSTTIPAPGPVRQPAPLPLPSPQAPRIPRPRAPTPPVPRASPRRFKPIRVAQGLGAASILRPILRRKTGESTTLQQLLPRIARPDVPPPVDRFGDPIAEVGTALQPGLTPINAPALGFLSQTAPRARRRDDECKCEETEEEKEDERVRSRSNVVAQVKTFRRRMSQNSLDNLRKGF